MKIKFNIIKVVMWFYILIPVFRFYYPEPTVYWPIILLVYITIDLYMSVEKTDYH